MTVKQKKGYALIKITDLEKLIQGAELDLAGLSDRDQEELGRDKWSQSQMKAIAAAKQLIGIFSNEENEE